MVAEHSYSGCDLNSKTHRLVSVESACNCGIDALVVDGCCWSMPKVNSTCISKQQRLLGLLNVLARWYERSGVRVLGLGSL